MNRNDWLTIPNSLTLSRVPIGLFIMGYLISLEFKTAFILYLVAVATDGLDGFFARLLNQLTELGSLLDRIADKILDYCTLPLIFILPQKFFVTSWIIMAITEGLQLELIHKIEKKNIQNVSSSRWWGKIKMALRSIAVIILLANLSHIYLPIPSSGTILHQISIWTNLFIDSNIWFYFYILSIFFGIISYFDHYLAYKKKKTTPNIS